MPRIETKKAPVTPTWYPLILPHTRLYDKPPTLNVVEEHPPAVVCDAPQVLVEYNIVKLSTVGQS